MQNVSLQAKLHNLDGSAFHTFGPDPEKDLSEVQVHPLNEEIAMGCRVECVS